MRTGAVAQRLLGIVPDSAFSYRTTSASAGRDAIAEGSVPVIWLAWARIETRAGLVGVGRVPESAL